MWGDVVTRSGSEQPTEAHPFGTVAIWGVGLIGGSIGMALRQRGLARQVIGIGRAADAEPGAPRPLAIRLGAVDRWESDPAVALAEADLLILAMPVQAMVDLAPIWGPRLRPGTLVTDVGSVKASVVAAWEAHLPPGVAFVGGHPMFGRERSGVEAAAPGLVPGCRWVLTPGAQAKAEAVAQLEGLVRSLGAHPLLMSPTEHDQRVAGASHLPQLVATALAAAAQELEGQFPGTLALAAGGFRDATRIAESPSSLWSEIWAANRDSLQQAVLVFRQALANLEGAVAEGDALEVNRLFERAYEARRQVTSL